MKIQKPEILDKQTTIEPEPKEEIIEETENKEIINEPLSETTSEKIYSDINNLSEKEDNIPTEEIVEETKETNSEVEKTESQDVSDSEDKPLNEAKEDDDEFIFSNFKEETPSNDSSAVEEVQKESEPETAQEDKLEKANDMLKNIVILSDDAILNALKKKHKTLTGKEATTFEDAIKGLEKQLNIPFIDEIKKIHKLREKADKEEVEIEDSSMALRTAKNFLSIIHL